jgi:hypothetical protein
MKWKLTAIGFVVGALVMFVVTRYEPGDEAFPPLPEGFEDIGLEVPSGTMNVERVWRKGLHSYGDNTPRVWTFYQELDASPAPEMADDWVPGGESGMATDTSALVHRVFRFYRDTLMEESDFGGRGTLRNRKYESSVFFSVKKQCVATLDVWYTDFGKDKRVGISILVIPDTGTARVTSEETGM